MALNFSHRPIFPSNGCVLEGGAEDMFCSSFLSDGDVKDCFDYGRDRCKSGGCSQDSIPNDIIDLLPSDPFGMEISTTFTAITGWFEDLEMDYGGYGFDVAGRSTADHQLFAGLNFLWDNAMRLQTFPGSIGFDCKSTLPSGSGGYSGAKGAAGSSCNFVSGRRNELCGHPFTDDTKAESACLGFESAHQVGGFGLTDFLGFSPTNDEGRNRPCCHVDFDSPTPCGSCGASQMKQAGNESCSVGFLPMSGFNGCSVENVGSLGATILQITENPKSSVRSCSDGNEKPDDLAALTLSLTCLGVRDLLSVERVCRTLHTEVRGDNLLWRNIHISQPLNERITDDILLQLTSRAQGQLQSLSLIECTRITDDGLKQVFESNPRISKLSVPGCTRLSINGIIEILRMCNSTGTLSVKNLRIGGLYGVTLEHFEKLRQLLGMKNDEPLSTHVPHFYNRGSLYLSDDDDRTIDIEMCPRCEKMRLVYDCPAEACQGKKEPNPDAQVCRACILCIARCVQCGWCINDGEYEETFCLEVLCSECSLEQRLRCQEEEGSSSKCVLQNVSQDGASLSYSG